MPLNAYGVLAARAVARRRETGDTPHYQIHLTDDAGVSYRAAVNVASQQAPSELLYLADDDLRHPITAPLAGLAPGWHPLPPRGGGPNLDFIRGNLFDLADMRALPPERPGVDNDLSDRLDHYVLRAIADPTAMVYVHGQRWGPEPATPDKIFGFLPGNGVHDVHMNQGNTGRFRGDNGVWQDGALIVHFPSQNRWVGIFLAFQSQAWHTDDHTGDVLDAAPPRPQQPGREPVRILAALVNPTGPAPEAETLTLLNASPHPVDLTGWRVADRAGRTFPLPAGTLAPGATTLIAVTAPTQLGNQGGTITLLDQAGLKTHGVSYTKTQAQEGWTVVF